MSNILLLNQPSVCVGVNSFTLAIPSTGQYAAEVQLTENPPSSCVVTVVNTTTATTLLTSPVLTPTQSAMQFKVGFQAAAADVITIALTSAAAIDNQLNTVQWTATIQQGY